MRVASLTRGAWVLRDTRCVRCRVEALHFQFIMLHEFVGTNVLHTFFVENVLADFLKCFCNSSVNVHKLTHQVLINNVFML